MKKLICLFLAAAILILPTACGNTSDSGAYRPEGESVSFEDPVDLAALYKEYFLASVTLTGGTGYKIAKDEPESVSFGGGETRLNLRLENDRFACDYGLYVVLNGVFQPFAVLYADGSASDYAYMQTFDLKENEILDVLLSFTPDTGEKGDTLPLCVCYISQPSFETAYTGDYGRYGHFHEHASRLGARCVLRMEADAPDEITTFAPAVENMELPQYYKDINGTGDEGLNVLELFSDEAQMKTDDRHRVLDPQRGEDTALYLDVNGIDASFRVTLFVNHEPVFFADGGSFAAFTAAKDKLTRVTLPVDTSAIPADSHAYLWIFDTEMAAGTYLPEGTYDLRGMLGTFFFLPSVKSGEAASSTVQETDSLDDSAEDRNTLDFIPPQYYARYIAKTDPDTLCVVAHDAAAEAASFAAEAPETVPYTVWFYDLNENHASGPYEINGDAARFFTAQGRLYTMSGLGGDAVILGGWNDKGNEVFTKDLTELYAEAPPMFDLQTILFTFLSPLGDTLLYNTAKNGALHVYLLPLAGGKAREIPLPEETRLNVSGFDGENILVHKAADGKSVLCVYSLNGEKQKEFDFGKSKTVSGSGRYYAVYDFGEFVGSAVTVLDVETLNEYPVTLSSAAEGRRLQLSENGEILLSFDDGSTFRVYNVKENRLIHTFDIGDENFLGMMFAFVDAENRTAYLPCGMNDDFRILREQW